MTEIRKYHGDTIEFNGILYNRYSFDSYEYDETGDTVNDDETIKIEKIFQENQTFFQKILCKLIDMLTNLYNTFQFSN